MNLKELVQRYIGAWNRQDVDGLLRLMHPGAAYYDAFWMESCVGRDLARYFQDAMDEEPYWYERVGDVIGTENGVGFRYSAHYRSDPKIDDPILYGAEVLVIRDNKILTVTDFYCSPDRADLKEVAGLVAKRHGVPTHANSGLSALKSMRLRAALSAKVDVDRVYLDPDVTVSELAEEIGCSIDQLSIVINKHFQTSIGDFLDNYRIRHASELLQAEADDPNIVLRAATQAGFRSSREFSDKFTDYFGVTPIDFHQRQNQKDDTEGTSNNH